MLNCIIVDDEATARQNLRLLLKAYCPDVNVLAEAHDKESIRDVLQKHQPDIVFMDVHLGKITCFDVMEELGWNEVDFKIIFVTASESHAIYGYKYNAIDYLLKPVHSQQLIEVVNKVKKLTIDAFPAQSVLKEFSKLYEKIAESPTISLVSGKDIHRVKVEDIVYCTGGGNYSTVILSDKREIVTSKKMMYFEEHLAQHDFLRIHKSHLINFAHIDSVSRADGLSITMSNGVLLPVARNRKEALMDRLNII